MSDLDDLGTITDAFETRHDGLTPKRVRAGKQKWQKATRSTHSTLGRLRISASKRNAKVTLASKA
jgi:hypothetical protein